MSASMNDLEAARPMREPLTPEELADLKARLHRSRAEVRSRGHEYDVADVVAVLEDFHNGT